jgi:hypothetical protein
MTSSEIEPQTFRLVAWRLNHYATAWHKEKALKRRRKPDRTEIRNCTTVQERYQADRTEVRRRK